MQEKNQTGFYAMRQFLLFIFLIVFTQSPAQQKKDSLWKCWTNKLLADTTRLKALNEYIYDYHILKQTDSILALLKIHNDYALKTGNKKEQASNLSMLGTYYNNKNKSLIARSYYRKSLGINRSINNQNGIAANYNQIGLAYFSEEQYDSSIYYYFNALKLFEQQKNINKQAAVYNNLGSIYSVLYDTLQELNCYEKAYAITMKSGNVRNQIITAINLAMCEVKIKERWDSVPVRINRHLEQCRKAGYKDLEIRMLASLADIYLYYKDYEKSLYYRQETGRHAHEAKDSMGICNYYYHLARLYYFQKQYAPVPELLKKSIGIAERNAFLRMKKIGAIFLSDVYYETGRFEEALKYYKLYIQAKDSMQSSLTEKIIFREQTKYEYEKKMLEEKVINDKAVFELKTQTAKLEYQKTLWIILSIGVILILGISFIFYRNNTHQKQIIATQKHNLTKQKLLVSQINPHFIFNSLNAIQNYIFKENVFTAGDYLSRFAKLMRMILDFSRQDYITVSEEVNFLESYLELQSLRFGNSFAYQISTDPDLDADSATIPPLLGQPFLENAVEHGMKNLNGKYGKISVHIYLESDMLVYEIQDNGHGLLAQHAANKPASQHKSLATQITRERLEAYTTTQAAYHIHITDKAQAGYPETGVLVKLSLPCKFK
ncbi:MAG: histidine kinase [Bacteroidetes bacterium]|nr:histidine kinase [Bacteroidota bacterium]